MGKRKKGRCAKNNQNATTENESLVQAPHTFVIRRGLPGGHVSELTKDFRKVMEPFTATALKERKRNTIKDFVSVAGLLHVSHLIILSQTELGVYFKVGRLPRGPTLTFKVRNFSLAKDVVSCLKKQNVVEAAFKHSPLIILNGFSSEEKQMKLMASTFQNMFPTINITNVDLNNVRRCVLMNYDPATNLIDFRHYVIKINPVGISKGVKKVVQGKVPKLNNFDDISDFLTKGGLLSESEAEDDPNHQIVLPQKIASRGNVESGKSAIRLSELGPRLTLQLIKVEDGLLDGEVLYHNLVEKSDEEKLAIQKKREAKKKLKEKRKKTQEKNTEKKEQAKEDLKKKSLAGMKKGQAENQDTAADEEDDDEEYYRQEVGEEPEKDLLKPSKPFQPHINRKRQFKTSGQHQGGAKKMKPTGTFIKKNNKNRHKK